MSEDEVDGGDSAGDPQAQTDADGNGGDATDDASDEEDEGGGFLSNIKNARSQLGNAKEAFSTARGGSKLPRDEEGRLRLVCRRYEERRAAPVDEQGRPACFEAGNEDCEDCVAAIKDGSIETW